MTYTSANTHENNNDKLILPKGVVAKVLEPRVLAQTKSMCRVDGDW